MTIGIMHKIARHPLDSDTAHCKYCVQDDAMALGPAQPKTTRDAIRISENFSTTVCGDLAPIVSDQHDLS